MANDLNIPDSVSLKCLFCGSDQFEIDEEKELGPGDMIKCAACGELNSYEGMMEVCEEEVGELVQDEVEKMLSKTLKDIFK